MTLTSPPPGPDDPDSDLDLDLSPAPDLDPESPLAPRSPDDAADAVLALRAAAGDQQAFAGLTRRHYAGLQQAARSFGIPDTDLDDVVQETWLAGWRALADYDPARSFRAWLFRIGLNKMRDHYRFRRVRRFFFGAVGLDALAVRGLPDPTPSPERQVESGTRLARVVALLDRLDTDQREALVLTALAGLSHAEAAEALDISPKAVEGRVTRARARLATLLETPDRVAGATPAAAHGMSDMTLQGEAGRAA